MPLFIIDQVLKIITAAAMREIDRLTTERYATPSQLLMEEAASSAAAAIATSLSNSLQGKHIRILCGPGNNGGDGAALARKLWLVGARVEVVLFGKVDDTHSDARTNFQIAQRLAAFEAGTHTQPPPLGFVECSSLSEWEDLAGVRHSYDLIVDALFGTGLTRPLEGVYQKVVEHLALLRRARERSHQETPIIVSLDLPSGLNADLAHPIGATIQADLTVSFTAPKAANVLPPASQYGGKLVVSNIGSPAPLLEAAESSLYLTEETDVRDWLVKTRYTPDSYKNAHGHVLIVGGSREMTGAVALCGRAAMRSGAGLVTVATSASAQPVLAARSIPEIMTASLPDTPSGAISSEAVPTVMHLVERATVVAIGPGMTHDNESTRDFVRAVLEKRTTPVVIDADALNSLAPWSEIKGSRELPLILTPHPGEMMRLMGSEDSSALEDRVRAASEFAAKHNVILVLKGTRTLVASDDGRVFINPPGNPGLGTAGAGDTLTGLVAGFLAQSYATLKQDADPLSATIAAVYIGGLAGDYAAKIKGVRSLNASDISDQIGSAIREIDPAGERP